MNKFCPTCKNPEAEFSIRKSGKRRGQPRPECKSCEKIRMDAYWDAHPEKRSEQRKAWRKRWRNAHRKPFRIGKTISLQRRLSLNLRNRIKDALKRNSKTDSTRNLLGCSIEHLKFWLTFYFQPGMSWANYGEWHIDHIQPCASFDLRDPRQQALCFNYTNLQPLWESDNLSKSDKVMQPDPEWDLLKLARTPHSL